MKKQAVRQELHKRNRPARRTVHIWTYHDTGSVFVTFHRYDTVRDEMSTTSFHTTPQRAAQVRELAHRLMQHESTNEWFRQV